MTKNNEDMNEISEKKTVCQHCIGANEPFCHVKLDSIVQLKDSTKKLLRLLEEIQSKAASKCSIHNDPFQLTELIKPIPSSNNTSSVTDVIGAKAIKRLEIVAKDLDRIVVEEEDDDCSVYKRLTRKCHCLNQLEYNDFMIHFNENTKYYTNNFGEIIKNMRILKKFLYMGGDYTKHALMFLNEGLSSPRHAEKVDIIQGCAHADICNIFDDQSIIIVYISWPCKYEYYGDTTTQELTASFVKKLVQLEEGRRYLKYSSKITNDIRKVLRKKSSQLNYDVLEYLKETLNLMHPPFTIHPSTIQNMNANYYSKQNDEGFGSKILTALIQYRQYMTLEEVFIHLNILINMSNTDSGKIELNTLVLPSLKLFKCMLMEYDNRDMNIVITNILNNALSQNMIKAPKLPTTVVMTETATDAVQMKCRMIQTSNKRNSPKLSKEYGKSQIRMKSKIQLKSQTQIKSYNLHSQGKGV